METPAQTGKRRVLVVDDEPTLRGLCRMLLADWGYGVTEASDGQEAWEELERRSVSIDAILLDVNMPRLRGDVLLARLGQAYPSLPVVIMTSESAVQNDVLRLGAKSVLIKPFRPAELESHIARAFVTPWA